MPSAPDLAPLIAALNTGFTNLVEAINTNQAAIDLAPLTAEVARVADAVTISNTQVASVIGEDNNGDSRVRTDPNVP